MTKTPTPTGPAIADLPMEWTAAKAAVKLLDKTLAATAGAALLGHAAAFPAWLTTTEVTVCAVEGVLLLGAAAVRRRAAETDPARWFSGGASFRPGELAPGELPKVRERC